MSSPVRINAFLASAGLGSRRSVESLVREGRVTLNGTRVESLSVRVDPERDQVACDGRAVKTLVSRYVLFHKPAGCACTRHDPHIRKTIYDLLPAELHHLAYAGRLDADSEGLLLLSNDGDWLERLAHPRHGVRKTYHVLVKGRPSPEVLDKARKGVHSEGELLKPELVGVLEESSPAPRKHVRGAEPPVWLVVMLREGRKREIRRIFGALGHPVKRLCRVAVGKLELGGLPVGKWRDLTPVERESCLV
ncbi:MAG: pseudouridine synthase [Verrucomicrobiae bacterium]|nr:pseudouridine synthase [Verrucomicrobiae bacterium]